MRGKGEGGVMQIHIDKCPKPVPALNSETGTERMVVPEHRCRGPWRAQVYCTGEPALILPIQVQLSLLECVVLVLRSFSRRCCR